MKMKYLQIETVQNLNLMMSNKNLKAGALWVAGKVANDNTKNERYVHYEAMRTSNSKALWVALWVGPGRSKSKAISRLKSGLDTWSIGSLNALSIAKGAHQLDDIGLIQHILMVKETVHLHIIILMNMILTHSTEEVSSGNLSNLIIKEVFYGKKNFAKLFPPKRIEEVAYILEHDLEGIEIPKEDERIKYILADPYAPEMKLIKRVYLIYNKTILELLKGKIHSIKSYEFKYPKKKNRKISNTDIEYALDMATIVVLASTNNKILTTYFISGSAEKLNSILNVCIGYSKDLEYDEYKASLQNFKNDIETVSQMGLLEKILGNDSGVS